MKIIEPPFGFSSSSWGKPPRPDCFTKPPRGGQLRGRVSWLEQTVRRQENKERSSWNI